MRKNVERRIDVELKIYQQNMCGYSENGNKKNGELNEREGRSLDGLLEILKTNPDVIFLSEVSKNLYSNIKNRKVLDGYTLKFPAGGLYGDYTTACILAIKDVNKYKFESKKRNSIILNKRYIEGTLSTEKSNINIECFFAYVPQTYDGMQKRIHEKRNMLEGIADFLNENENEFLLIAGDLNTDIKDNNAKCRKEFQEILDCTIDTVVDENKGKPTWNNKCLDYALVSNSLEDKCYTQYVSKKETGSDHKGLLTTITIEENI